ncbi:glycosyltransferase family 4 protein [Empedobacter falsenii]
MKNNKVLHIVSVSFSLRYFIGNQFRHFKNKGYDFTVACSPSEDFFDYGKEIGFKPFPIIISRSINPIQDLISIYKLYRFIKKEKFDIVISHSPKGGLIGMVASFLAGTPKRVFFRHGLVFETSKGLKKQLLINIERIIGFCAHKVVNVSQSIQDKSDALNLNVKNKNVILGKGTCNGVNTNLFTYNEKSEYKDKVVIGFIGRLCPDKGINELIDSLNYLDDINNLVFLLIGPLDERDKLDLNTINTINTHPKIKYIGEVKNTAYYYNQMDIFILPSYREGFPTVNLEASASGLPIITTRSTGCIDSIVEFKTGIFTEINKKSIADAVRYYVLNEDVRKLNGQNGKKFVLENFSEKIIYKEIQNKILND